MVHRSTPRFRSPRPINRRQFLQALSAGVSSAAFLSACQPSIVAPTGSEVGAPSTPRSEWVTGNIPADLAVPFRYSSWEGEEEMRKWLLHFDTFFGENYPLVTVQGDWGVPWGEYWTKVPTQLAGGAEIELMWMHDSRCQSFASQGWLLPLNEYIEAFPLIGWPDEFYPSQVRAFQYQGRQYGIPYDFASSGLYINLDLFEEAGIEPPTVETTWEELLEIALALTKKEGDEVVQWGLGGLEVNRGGPTYAIVKCFGGDYWNTDITESRFNDPATIATFQFLADLLWEHEVMPSADMLASLGIGAHLAFSSGLTAMHFTANDVAFRLHENIGDSFRWGFAPTPQGPAGQFYFVAGSALSIPQTSAQQEMAYELIRYMLSSPEALPISGEMGSQFTGNMNFFEFGLPPKEWGVDREAFQEVFYELPRQFGIAPSYHPKYLEWETSVYATAMDPLWVGEERDAAAACQMCHELTNQLLSS